MLLMFNFLIFLVAKAVHDINETVRSSESASTLTALKSSELSLRSITDECSETYHEKLLQARDGKTSGTVNFCVGK